MRKLLTILFLFIGMGAFAAHLNYYISTGSGNNTTGRSSDFAWHSIDSIITNMSKFVPGDSILFKRGETFFGSIDFIRAGVSGNNIIIGAYGTGAAPIISGFKTATGWSNLGGNIWETTVAATKNLNLVTRDGLTQQIGRFPNANAAAGGYLTFTASSTTTITGSALASTTNWQNAEVAIRDARWDIKKRVVTSHIGGQLTWATSMVPKPKTVTSTTGDGYGYFFQRDPRTLDLDGEWYHNEGNGKLRMYFANNNPNAYTVKYASVDTVLSIERSFITLVNISVTGGNMAGIMVTGGSGYYMTNVNASQNGGDGIAMWFISSDVFVTGCTAVGNLSSGIRVFGATTSSNFHVNNDTVLNTALFAGMENNEIGSSGNAVYAKVQTGLDLKGNVIRNSAYNGIQWKGDNVLIENNYIDTFCSVRDDGGAIYTFEGTGSTIVNHVNRIIRYNILGHGIGAKFGAPLGTTYTDIQSRLSANGIYCDEGSRDIQILFNTIFEIPYHGIQGNGNGNITVYGNTIYHASRSAIGFQRLETSTAATGFLIKKNIIYPYRFRFRDQAINKPTQFTQLQSLTRFGILDSNYYSIKAGVDTSYNVQSQDSVVKVQPPLVQASSNFSESYLPFSYLTGTAHQELHSINANSNAGILYYNESNTLKVVKFTGLRKRDPTGAIFDNFVNVPAFTSVILIDNGNAPVANQPPTVSVGSAITLTLPANSTTLTGTASDDGAISGYQWTYVSGPATYTLGSPTAASTSLSNLVEGTYQFRLTVTDNGSPALTASSTISVTVNPAVIVANQPPTVNPGPNQTITAPASSVVMAALGSDGDGSIASYFWVETSGPATYNIVTPSAANTTINNLVPGVYIFQVTVTDNRGGTAFANVRVQVNAAPVNQPPTAIGGGNKSTQLPANSVTLNGSGTDDGSIISYHWDYFSGPASYTIASPSSATTNITNLVAGTYQFQLTVTDNGSPALTGTAFVVVTVTAAAPPPNIAPTVNPGTTPRTLTLPTSSLVMNAVGSDLDGNIASYFWDKIAGPATFNIVSPSAANTTINGLVAGTYTFRVVVKDNLGASATGNVQVIVNPAPINLNPVVTAGSDIVLTLPTNSTTLSGSATDDGSIGSYHWDYFSGPATYTIASASSASTGLSNLVAGTYEFQLTATDNQGAVGTDIVIVKVNPAVIVPNQLPTMNPGSPIVIGLPTNTVTMSALASDADGTITSYFWSKLTGPAQYTIVTPTDRNTVINNLVAGVYEFQVTATDNRGGTVTGIVKVTVNDLPPNVAPQAYAGQDVEIELPATSLTLVGSGDDADGTISAVNWTIVSGPSGAVFSAANASTTVLSNLTEGVYQIDFKVTDNSGATATDRVRVIVFPVPQPPAQIPSSSYLILSNTIYKN